MNQQCYGTEDTEHNVGNVPYSIYFCYNRIVFSLGVGGDDFVLRQLIDDNCE